MTSIRNDIRHRSRNDRRFRRPLSAALALALCAGCTGDGGGGGGAAAVEAPALDTPRARVSYMVGLDMAKTMAPVRDEVDLEIAIAAIRAVHAGRAPAMDDVQAKAVREQFGDVLRKKQELAMRERARRNLAQAQAFLAKNAGADGVRTTASGLQYQVLRKADGPTPNDDATVRVHYTSKTLSGEALESTYAADHSTTIALGQVFPGWREGVGMMSVGSQYRFWIPPELAYGERGAPGRIEPNALLVFDVELLEIAGLPQVAPDPSRPQPSTQRLSTR